MNRRSPSLGVPLDFLRLAASGLAFWRHPQHLLENRCCALVVESTTIASVACSGGRSGESERVESSRSRRFNSASTCSTSSAVTPLGCSTPCPFVGGRGQVHLQVGVREHDRADVASLDHPAVVLSDPSALAADELRAHVGVGGHGRHGRVYRRSAYRPGRVMPVDRAPLRRRRCRGLARERRQLGCRAGPCPLSSAAQATARYIAPVSSRSRPRCCGQIYREGRLARSGRTVDGDRPDGTSRRRIGPLTAPVRNRAGVSQRFGPASSTRSSANAG